MRCCLHFWSYHKSHDNNFTRYIRYWWQGIELRARDLWRSALFFFFPHFWMRLRNSTRNSLVRRSVRRSVGLPVHLTVHPSDCLSAWPSISLTSRRSIFWSLRRSVHHTVRALSLSTNISFDFCRFPALFRRFSGISFEANLQFSDRYISIVLSWSF